MSRISTKRHSSPSINTSIHCGRPKVIKPVAAPSEITRIDKAILSLHEAKKATDLSKYALLLTEAFRLTRDLTREQL